MQVSKLLYRCLKLRSVIKFYNKDLTRNEYINFKLIISVFAKYQYCIISEIIIVTG